MAPKNRAHHYSQQQQEKLDRIELPPKIQCGDCGKSLFHGRFSNRQLGDYKQNIYREGKTTPKLPRCRPCVGGPREEMLCTGCDIVKGLDLFAQTQRRKPDEAKCRDCQQGIDDVEPDTAAAVAEEEIKEEIALGGSTIGSGLSSLGALGSALPGGKGRPSTNVPSSQPWGGYVASPRPAETSSTADSGAGVWVQKDLDVSGQRYYSSPRRPEKENEPPSHTRALSVTSEAISNTSTDDTRTSTGYAGIAPTPYPYRPSVSSNRNPSSVGGNNPKFAKQRAVPEDRELRIRNQLARDERKRAEEEERAHARDESDEEDSEWEM